MNKGKTINVDEQSVLCYRYLSDEPRLQPKATWFVNGIFLGIMALGLLVAFGLRLFF